MKNTPEPRAVRPKESSGVLCGRGSCHERMGDSRLFSSITPTLTKLRIMMEGRIVGKNEMYCD